MTNYEHYRKDIEKLARFGIEVALKKDIVDWTQIPVDTPILVRDNGEYGWYKKHFAKYEDNKVYVWNNGTTSFTADNDYRCTSHWKYAKLAEKVENDG